MRGALVFLQEPAEMIHADADRDSNFLIEAHRDNRQRRRIEFGL